MTTILITGASGFIGRNLAEQFLLHENVSGQQLRASRPALPQDYVLESIS